MEAQTLGAQKLVWRQKADCSDASCRVRMGPDSGTRAPLQTQPSRRPRSGERVGFQEVEKEGASTSL